MADTLTITDNRTGKQYEIPIKDGAIKGFALPLSLKVEMHTEIKTSESENIVGVLLGTDTFAGGVIRPRTADAAFAALQTKAPVLEGFGLKTFGAHSNEREYVEVPSIEPRLYLLTRMIVGVSQGTIVLGGN